jgi:hypothetical protein
MQDSYLKNKIAYFPYRKLYLGTKLFPVSRCRYKNAHIRKREDRHELYIKFKKFKQARRRRQLIAELRETSNRINQD